MNSSSFMDKLEWSQGQFDAIRRIIVNRIPGCTDVVKASLELDLKGTDWLAQRANLLPLGIDVKVRETDYLVLRGEDDLALETWSKIDISDPDPGSPFVAGKQIGWTRDPSKNSDYILWYWADTGRSYLVPFPPLCFVFSRLWRQWVHRYQVWPQHSKEGWYSQCVFVPRTEVQAAINRWMYSQTRTSP